MKLLRLNGENYLVVISRGQIDGYGLKDMFTQIKEVTSPLLDCRVLIDLQDAIWQLTPADVCEIVDKLASNLWPHSNKVALVSAPERHEFDQLLSLTCSLSTAGFNVAAFDDEKSAATWLADGW